MRELWIGDAPDRYVGSTAALYARCVEPSEFKIVGVFDDNDRLIECRDCTFNLPKDAVRLIPESELPKPDRYSAEQTRWVIQFLEFYEVTVGKEVLGFLRDMLDNLDNQDLIERARVANPKIFGSIPDYTLHLIAKTGWLRDPKDNR
ncbi:hypothetical protein [Gordonia sp. N1V]|uniref:hypothetical protein n=1 Tax=Gordonia sp. N1V TaxID=3034163 RepID=UPI0023E32711|nr:hypothetical protein [Gordonia sp. N1V]MDF3280875.1 hypothetical protein [Gordonia sp. N1V]